MREKIVIVAIQTIKWTLVGAIIVGTLFLILNEITSEQPKVDKENSFIIKSKTLTDLNYSFLDGAMVGMMAGAILGSIFAAHKAGSETGWIMLTGAVSGLLAGILNTIYDPTKSYMILWGAGLGVAAWPLFHMRMQPYYHLQDKIKSPKNKHFFWPIYGTIIGLVIFEFIPSSLFGDMGINSGVVGMIIGAVVGLIALIIQDARLKRII